MDDQNTCPPPVPSTAFPLTFLADVACCIRFFSRLPIPRLGSGDRPDAPPRFDRSAYAAPIAGVIVALPAAALLFALSFSALPDLVTGILVTLALTAVTGALHEDGLADVADGFFGGHDRQRRLDIMKDSRIGAFGGLALAGGLFLRASLIAGLLAMTGGWAAVLLLLTGEALSRALMVWQWASLPPARDDGLGARFGIPSALQAALAGVLAAVLLPVAWIAAPIGSLALGCVLAILLAFSTGIVARRKIGGFTGDVLGTIQQVSGLGFLIGLQLMNG